MRLMVQLNSETSMETSATYATALRPVFGTIASLAISQAAGPECATTKPITTPMQTCRVNGMIDQKPSPNASAIDTGPAPMARHPTATTAIAITANTNASGYQRSDQSVIASAMRSRKPASEVEPVSSACAAVVIQ
jgi:hypothetical protein